MTASHWEVAYQAAVLETDNSLLSQKVTYAEVVIRLDLQPLDGDPAQSEERQELEKALVALDVLRKERLGFRR
jgi:hypothetical protein